jgi:hypothetical protein
VIRPTSWWDNVTGFAALDRSPFVNTGVKALDDFIITYDDAERILLSQ